MELKLQQNINVIDVSLDHVSAIIMYCLLNLLISICTKLFLRFTKIMGSCLRLILS